MELKFKQEELSFLLLYSICANEKTEITDKFQILSIENSTDIALLQLGVEVRFITILKDKNINKDTFVLTYQTQKFSEILKYCFKDDEITITDTHVNFGKASKYTFESFDNTEYLKVDAIMTLLEKSNSCQKMELFDFEKINLIKSYLGENSQGLDTIGFFDNHFVTTNRTDGSGIVKTKNKIDKNYYFPIMLYQMYNYLKLSSVIIYDIEDEDIHEMMFKYNDTYLFFSKVDAQLKLDKEGGSDSDIFPNILSDKIKKMYYHNIFLTINKEEILRILRKISAVTSSEFSNRIFISFKEDKIIIETKDIAECYEEIKCDIPESLLNIMLVCGISYSINMISSIPDKDIIIRVPDSVDNLYTVCYSDKEESVIFIQNLHSESGYKNNEKV